MITPFYSQNEDLLVGADKSALKEDGVKTAGTIEVYSISKFAINLVLCIGEMGDEGSEIVQTHVTTAPSGTTVTLHSALTKDHPKDTPVYIIPYNQVEFSWNSSQTPSIATNTVRSTQTVDSERTGNRWDEVTYTTTGNFFTRWINSITGAYSNYSDPYPVAGQEMNTVGYLIEDASDGLDEEGKVKFETKIRIINKGLRYIRGKLKRWNTFQEFDYSLGITERGKYEYDISSTTIHDKNSNKSILAIRIGDGDNLKYMDKRELNSYLEDSVHTTVATAPSVGDTTLILTSGYNLPSSGSVNIYYSGTVYNVTYTGITASTGVLTGVPASGTGSITVAFPAGTNVWYGETEGEPTRFTIYDGKLALQYMPDASYDNMNIFADFYTDIVEVDSEADVITLGRYDMLYNYLRWELRNIIERNGKKDYTDGDWMMFKEILTDAIRKEVSGQKFKYKVKINRIADRRGNKLPFDRS